MAATIGIDIGGTKVLAVRLEADGSVANAQKVEVASNDFDALVRECVGLADALDSGGAPIGVGAAGMVDTDGNVQYAPNLPSLRQVPLQRELARVSARPVVVDNDANVAALGEVAYGAGAGVQDVLFVTLGTGVGGGLVLDGRIYHGAHNFAGEIGHFRVDPNGPMCACGRRGHWEATASGTALGRMARELVARGGGAAILELAGGVAEHVQGIHVGQAARAGDPDALQLLSEYAECVAVGLAGLANILDPARIVISGGLVELGSLLFDPLTTAFLAEIEGSEHRPLIPIVPAALGERAGAVGAAVLARDLAK
ncbi:MAG TPA: ROK family protein [Acidimicrobiia bacterium]|nr:ROK family protein [Acidimicrobiia bacterium]